ncbi:hypothetical protein SD77_4388 [Bacillus badius]|uniref:Ribose 5-phosphate isomerase B n=1 Tax=Bacillus badius TaxID=1455 RepID=A0ABR5AWW0_BACBA|nr:hypothetical protein SD77_4388 [Bacillus badius]
MTVPRKAKGGFLQGQLQKNQPHSLTDSIKKSLHRNGQAFLHLHFFWCRHADQL